MKVADLAAELEVPASTVLDQCQRFGIDAAWAGADLSGADVVVLRAELAASGSIDLTTADPSPEPEPDPASVTSLADPVPATVPSGPEAATAASAAPGPASAAEPAVAGTTGTEATPAVPPTVVGSMPDLIEEITPDDDPPPTVARAAFAGASGAGIDPNATRRVAPTRHPEEVRVDRSARNSVIALFVAAALFIASNFTGLPALVTLLWFLTALALAVAVLDAIRGRRHVQTHPERFTGLWLASISLVIAIAGLVGLTASVVTAIGEEPVADAPMSIGDLQSVQVARWGYHRVNRFADNGWRQPAREQGTCWGVKKGGKIRDEQRVEVAEIADRRDCEVGHTLEVAKVFAVNRDADAPYPGSTELLAVGQEECGPIVQRLAGEGETAALVVEYPTEVGWGDGDHDVACALITSSRNSPLTT